MASIVITAIGDDRAGLVDALSQAVSTHGGNWEQSHMAELAGKFAGIVLVTVPDTSAEALLGELDALEARGLLDITAERSTQPDSGAHGRHITLELVGADHPGIVHDISHALATHGVSIEQLETSVGPAPQGGDVFTAAARLAAPPELALDALRDALEAVAADLMVDLELGVE